MLRMSSEQICLQVSPKMFRVSRWILQMIRQWIPDSWSGDRKCTSPKGAVANSWNWQLMTSGRSQVLATSNFRDWHTVVGEILWSLMRKTMMDCHSKLVLQSLRNNQPVQVIVHQPTQTMLIFPGLSERMCCSILTSLAQKTKQRYSSRRAMWQKPIMILVTLFSTLWQAECVVWRVDYDELTKSQVDCKPSVTCTYCKVVQIITLSQPY